MKVFYCIFFAAILTAVSADFNLKSINDEPRGINYSVRVIDSNVPDQSYNIDAVGVVQLILNSWDGINPEPLLDNIQFLYQEYHSAATWKVSSNCSFLLLPYNAWYIKLQEILTGTEIILFATPFDPIPSTSTLKPNSTSTTSTTTISPTTTGAPLPFSVSLVNYENLDTQFVLEATGLLQFYLEQERDFNKALPEFLESLQEYETREIWKLAGSCSYVQNYTDYIWFYESYTRSDVVVFA
ncbi:hypothetical protein ABEB36_012499 [Hypothenemus hampei]|uniref:Uncharacterized protein n=1 Tax=Hypothenemus hampei TaxID=57062 RepID=A0ABD1EE50_HYPHA